jgi:hypothetical protein
MKFNKIIHDVLCVVGEASPWPLFMCVLRGEQVCDNVLPNKNLEWKNDMDSLVD